MSLAEIADDKMPLRPTHEIGGGGWLFEEPSAGQLVEVYALDWRGAYLIPFRVIYAGGDFMNAESGDVLAAEIAGWRPWNGIGGTGDRK